MTGESIFFRTDAGIIAKLGRELVAKQETALVELVKNAYDADATEVTVEFINRGSPDASLIVTDDGNGMTRHELIDGFMRLASDLKVANPTSPKFGRTRAGRKGIGRFSTQRLGNKLTVTTQVKDATNSLRLVADWTDFVPGRYLDDIFVRLEELPSTRQGTTLLIECLQDDWSTSQMRACWRSVIALQQPFPVRPVQTTKQDHAPVHEADPGFKATFLDSGGLFADPALVADMQSEILDYLPVVIEMTVDEHGAALWRISKNAFGPTRDWRPINHEHRDSLSPPAYSSLRNVAMKTYHVILEPSLLPSIVFTRVRDILSREGGIRLYRNGFRVTPYGEPDDDWLRLDEIYARRGLLANLANRNFFGVIEVQDPEGKLFEERTSREGLIENNTFSELRGLASSVLVTAATLVHADRGRKTHANRPPPRPEAAAALSEVRAAVRAVREAAERTEATAPGATEAVIERVVEAEQILEITEKNYEEVKARLADEAAMLRLLASLGMTTAEFSHEMGMAFEAFRLDFERVFEAAAQARPSDPLFELQAARAKAAIVRLDTLTAYLNTTVASRAVREIHPVSLSKAVESFVAGMRAHASTQDTEIEVATPPLDALYTDPMHEAEVASVLLNFHTNALKAMKRTNNARRILIIADRVEAEAKVRVRFCDTGDGVAEQDRTRIFDAFFTKTSAPSSSASDEAHARGTGLGLWIVNQIAGNAGGEVSVADPPSGYATCFELKLPAETIDD